MITAYLQTVVVAAILIVLVVGALVGIWNRDADAQDNMLRPTTLTGEVRESLLQARRAKAEEVRKERKARRMSRRTETDAQAEQPSDVDLP